MKSCSERYDQILHVIFEGSDPYEDQDARFASLQHDIKDFEGACGGNDAEILRCYLDQKFGHADTPSLVMRLRRVATSPGAPVHSRLKALTGAATLSYRNPYFPPDLSVQFRSQAYTLAFGSELWKEAFNILNNWLFAALSDGDLQTAKERINDIERILREHISQPIIASDPNLVEVQARFKTHQAKYLLQTAVPSNGDAADQVLCRVEELYESAISDERANVHRRVNKQIEWASSLVKFARTNGYDNFDRIEAILDRAYRSLDAHVCSACRGYFYYTRAELLGFQGGTLFNTNRDRALDCWRGARRAAIESIDAYRREKHHFENEASDLLLRVEEELAKDSRPQEIFLSHKTVNKDLVLRFEKVLRELGFSPWMDVDKMPAGTQPLRGIHSGMKGSCACVFFVTPDFEDDKYLRTEIDLAMKQKVERGDEFAIIALVFGRGEVPEILKQYIYKECRDEMEGLLQILRALPIRVGTVHWRV